MVGRILAVYSAWCEVASGSRTYRCLFRGRLRKGESAEIYPGDLVEIEESGKVMAVKKVLPRKNLLVRPPVANIDRAVIVTAITRPEADLAAIDRLFVHLESQGIEGSLCINKSDIEDPEKVNELREIYQKAGYPVDVTSAVTGEGLDSLKERMQGGTSILAGQSGVGKSKLLTALLGVGLATGELGRTGRGRHTTKGVTLFRVGESGFLADTPGFSKLEGVECEPEELSYYYPEMADLVPLCRYPRCLHKTEDPCAVREAVSDGRISPQRYANYLKLLEESLERMKRKYE